MKVKECMCDDVCCVKAETNIKEVAKLMSGIVTDRDILLRCVACDKDTNQTSVSEIMSCNVCTCKEDDDITNAQTQMSQNQIRRLPVCNSKNEVVGILTLGDLAQNTQSIGQQQVNETIENICNCHQNKNAE